MNRLWHTEWFIIHLRWIQQLWVRWLMFIWMSKYLVFVVLFWCLLKDFRWTRGFIQLTLFIIISAVLIIIFLTNFIAVTCIYWTDIGLFNIFISRYTWRLICQELIQVIIICFHFWFVFHSFIRFLIFMIIIINILLLLNSLLLLLFISPLIPH